MRSQPHSGPAGHSYVADDPATALKFAIQHMRGTGCSWSRG